jgi:DNA polymerase III subunit delta'
MTSSVWDNIVQQPKAVERLQQLAVNHVHAFLFIGPDGCGKEDAARAFASRLITQSDDATSREANLIMRGSFSDVIEVLREGAAVDKDEAEAIIRLSTTTPTESRIKVVIVHEVHLMRDSAAARLLKTIEEPSEKVVFILLADALVPALATINSRCVVVQFAAINIHRERLLANDPRLAQRQEAFSNIPYKLDGSGATVATIVDEIFELIEQATTPLVAQHKVELEELEARVALTGERGSGRKTLQDRQKRQLRKFNTDELRSGLATIAGTYHALILSDTHYPEEPKYHDAIHRIHKAMGSLGFNVNEELLLQSLFLQCPSLMMHKSERSRFSYTFQT